MSRRGTCCSARFRERLSTSGRLDGGARRGGGPLDGARWNGARPSGELSSGQCTLLLGSCSGLESASMMVDCTHTHVNTRTSNTRYIQPSVFSRSLMTHVISIYTL
eukprot:265143-Pyramimonas_sp.AAC.1